jgi:hypothetical protein
MKDGTPASNGVWQLVAGESEWTYFSDNLDFVDETEMEDAIAAAIALEETDRNTAITNAVEAEAGARDEAIVAATKTTLADQAASDTLPSASVSATFASLFQTIRNNLKWLFANKVDKNGTDRLMTAGEGTKLEGIQAGAQVNPGYPSGTIVELGNGFKRKVIGYNGAGSFTLYITVNGCSYLFPIYATGKLNTVDGFVFTFLQGTSIVDPNYFNITPYNTVGQGYDWTFLATGKGNAGSSGNVIIVFEGVFSDVVVSTAPPA